MTSVTPAEDIRLACCPRGRYRSCGACPYRGENPAPGEDAHGEAPFRTFDESLTCFRKWKAHGTLFAGQNASTFTAPPASGDCDLRSFRKYIKEPSQARIHHGYPGCDGANPEGTQR
jgi:hypothetical protein